MSQKFIVYPSIFVVILQQRALRAEATVAKLMEEVNILKVWKKILNFVAIY